MYNLCNEPPWMITVLNRKLRLQKKGITTKENLETLRSNNLIVDYCRYNTKPLFYMAIGSLLQELLYLFTLKTEYTTDSLGINDFEMVNPKYRCVSINNAQSRKLQNCTGAFVRLY
jgi:hypothetical protein